MCGIAAGVHRRHHHAGNILTRLAEGEVLGDDFDIEAELEATQP